MHSGGSRGLLEDALTQFADCHFPKNGLPPKLFDLVFDFFLHRRPIGFQRPLRAYNTAHCAVISPDLSVRLDPTKRGRAKPRPPPAQLDHLSILICWPKVTEIVLHVHTFGMFG